MKSDRLTARRLRLDWRIRVCAWRAAAVGVLAGLITLGLTQPVLAGSLVSMGITRTQAESLFHAIDGSNTVFRSASSIKGVPRVLGGDRHLYTVVELNGFPQVEDVQVVSIIDTANRTILVNQVMYDSLVCRVFSTTVAQNWCTSRILNTSAKGMLTASQTRSFGGLQITVRTYLSSKGSGPPIASLDLHSI